MKKYIPLKPNERGYTHIKIDFYYDLGGSRDWNGVPEQRGYYIRVFPVTREEKHGVIMESFDAYGGAKLCVLPVSKKGKKAEAIAVKKAEQIENVILNYVLHHLGLEEGETT